MNTRTDTSRPLPPELLGLPVAGTNLRGATLGDELSGPTLLVFLRHFG